MTKELEGQMNLSDLGIWYGKTYSEPCQATKERTSDASSKKPQGSSKQMPLFLDLRRGGGINQAASWEMGGALLGEYTMHSFGEYPNEENVSHLSQILEEAVHPKYSLSAKACQGILNRANKRGKKLPEILQKALEAQIEAAPSR